MCGGFTPLRDTLESAASLVGNYYLPGSSLLTDQLVSKGSQKQLGSTVGQLAQLGTGLTGGGFGETVTGIPSAAEVGGGYTNFGNSLGSLFGSPSLGSDIGGTISNGLDGITGQISDGLSSIGNATGVSDLFNSASAGTGSGLQGDFADGLNSIYAPSSAASSAPGTISSGFTPTASSAGSLGGGTVGGFFQDPGLSGAGNSAGGFFSPANQALDNAAVSGQLGGTGNFLGSAISDFSPNIDSSALSQPFGSSFASAAPSTAQTAFSDAGSQLLGTGSKGVDLSSIFGGGGNGSSNLVNGALRTGLSNIFNQNPYSGSPQVANTLNNSAQQYNPFVQGGTQAQTQLSNLYGLNGQDAANSAQQDWQNTPGYQFQLAQGTGALQNSAAAQGGLLNGNTGEALQKYGQGLAGTTYQQYLDNLQKQAGQGQTALGNQANLQGQAAQLNQQPKQYQANQNNQGIGGILASLFPTQQQTNNNSGLFNLYQ